MLFSGAPNRINASYTASILLGSGLTKMSKSFVARGWAWMLTAQPPMIRYLTPQARKAARRSQQLMSTFSFIAALLEESKTQLLRGHQPLDGRPALPIGVLLVLRLQQSDCVVPENTNARFVSMVHETHPSWLSAACSSAQAFTLSNASAAFVNRRSTNSASINRKNESRSASSAKPIATPFSLSGASVNVARNSLT